MKFMENTKINFMKFKSFGFGLVSVSIWINYTSPYGRESWH